MSCEESVDADDSDSMPGDLHVLRMPGSRPGEGGRGGTARGVVLTDGVGGSACPSAREVKGGKGDGEWGKGPQDRAWFPQLEGGDDA